ncbi:MAG: NADH-quinone oxidoreductase subunit L [Pseudomonadota bacterium]
MEPSTVLRMVFLPFGGALLLGVLSLWKKPKAERWAGPLASVILAFSFFAALGIAMRFFSGEEAAPLMVDMGSWMNTGAIDFRAQLHIDALSALLSLVVTGVGLLIHIYSIGYMAHDEGRTRYFAYLNLFCGFMLLLLTGASLPLIFVGWEGVGFSSYILIAFWFSDIDKAKAGKKAFIVNRIGDVGFLMAMFLCLHLFGTLDVGAVLKGAPVLAQTHPGVVEAIALLFFLGCAGKSAQIPLYIWLPDAMAGPTPVSALIHAATMVTAGVYLLARLSGLYHLAPFASEVVASVGALTAFLAATMALAQRDIKKVLAFSTVSQLGFMVLAMGVGAYWAGIFHLVTHAFFKALLFLAAGSVIHALHGEQDIFKMGGLKNYIVGTTLTFLAGFLGIVGFPLFSGWFSKDAILFGVASAGHTTLLVLAVIAALLTVLYMSRLFCLVFLGIPQIDRRQLSEVRESGRTMLWPMWVLAFLAAVGGALPFKAVLKEFFGAAEPAAAWITEGQLTGAVTILVLLVLFFSIRTYQLKPAWLTRFSSVRLKEVLARQYFFDDVAVAFFGALTRGVSWGARLFDEHVVDRAIGYVARKVEGAGYALANLQSGQVQAYAFSLLAGCFLVGWYLVGLVK